MGNLGRWIRRNATIAASGDILRWIWRRVRVHAPVSYVLLADVEMRLVANNDTDLRTTALAASEVRFIASADSEL